MIAAIRATFGEPGLDRLLRERTRMQKKQYRRPDSFRGSCARRCACERLAEIRREQGYMAECAAQARRLVYPGRESLPDLRGCEDRARDCAAKSWICSAPRSVPGRASNAPVTFWPEPGAAHM